MPRSPSSLPTLASNNPIAAPSQQMPRDKMWLFVALLIGGIFRFYRPLTSDFPLEDGGLFYLMAQTIRAHHFLLPATIPYPTVAPSIPFCYPPLALYEAAFFNVLGIPLETALRLAPAFWATLTIYALWKLARTILEPLPQGKQAADFSALLWGVMIWSFLWMIMGGGLTRAPGLFWAILGAEAGISLWRDEKNNLFWVAVWLALAILTHLERAHFLVISLAVIWLVYSRSLRGAGQLGAILGIALLLSAPWWGLCLSRFGLAPFLASFHSGSSAWANTFQWQLLFKAEAIFPLLSIVGFIGLVAFGRKIPLLPLWFLVILCLEVRSLRNFMLIPLVMAMALVLLQIRPRLLRHTVMMVSLLWGALQCSLVNTSYVVLPPGEREAMAWARDNTPPTARFFVFPSSTKRNDWASDLPNEWFPALARRTSVLTVQGSEWLPNNLFLHQRQNYDALALPTSWQGIEAVMRQRHINFDYVFLPTKDHRGQTQFLRQMAAELKATGRFALVHFNKDATIWKRLIRTR